MSNLTFEEFIKLPENEQCKRYEELSSHDKFLARLNQNPISPNNPPMTDEEMANLPPETRDILDQIKKMFGHD